MTVRKPSYFIRSDSLLNSFHSCMWVMRSALCSKGWVRLLPHRSYLRHLPHLFLSPQPRPRNHPIASSHQCHIIFVLPFHFRLFVLLLFLRLLLARLHHPLLPRRHPRLQALLLPHPLLPLLQLMMPPLLLLLLLLPPLRSCLLSLPHAPIPLLLLSKVVQVQLRSFVVLSAWLARATRTTAPAKASAALVCLRLSRLRALRLLEDPIGPLRLQRGEEGPHSE